jgi:hypothetical protein
LVNVLAPWLERVFLSALRPRSAVVRPDAPGVPVRPIIGAVSLAPGARLGQYQIVAGLGEGGVGVGIAPPTPRSAEPWP